MEHVFGVIGLSLIIVAWQYRDRSSILFFNAAAFLFFALELYLLGALTGSIIMISAFAQAVFAHFYRKTWVAILVTVPSAALGVLGFQSWIDVLPVIAHFTAAVTFFSKDVLIMRAVAPIGTILWLIHNITVGAWAQSVTDMLILSAMIVGYLKNHIIRN